jgi:hypothetical protein
MMIHIWGVFVKSGFLLVAWVREGFSKGKDFLVDKYSPKLLLDLEIIAQVKRLQKIL